MTTTRRHTLLYQEHRTTDNQGRELKAVDAPDRRLRITTVRLTPEEKVWLGARVQSETITVRAAYGTRVQLHLANRTGTVWSFGPCKGTVWVVFDGSDHPVEVLTYSLDTVTKAVAD